MFHMGRGSHDGIHGLLNFKWESILTAVRRIFGRSMHSQPALHSQWDKGWKNNSPFVSPSIRRPTL